MACLRWYSIVLWVAVDVFEVVSEFLEVLVCSCRSFLLLQLQFLNSLKGLLSIRFMVAWFVITDIQLRSLLIEEITAVKQHF